MVIVRTRNQTSPELQYSPCSPKIGIRFKGLCSTIHKTFRKDPQDQDFAKIQSLDLIVVVLWSNVNVCVEKKPFFPFQAMQFSNFGAVGHSFVSGLLDHFNSSPPTVMNSSNPILPSLSTSSAAKTWTSICQNQQIFIYPQN